jgi:hypothetical protein
MKHKKKKASHLPALNVRELHRRRRRVALMLQGAEATVQGRLVTQGRRCGKAECRCTQGELHGPYVYVALARPRGGSRLLYVPDDRTGRGGVGRDLRDQSRTVSAPRAEMRGGERGVPGPDCAGGQHGRSRAPGRRRR